MRLNKLAVGMAGVLATIGVVTVFADTGSNAMSPDVIKARMQPVGQVTTTSNQPQPKVEAAATGSSSAKLRLDVKSFPQANLDAGKKTYDQYCHVCHGAGIAGAPKFGDVDAWKPHVSKGVATLYKHAIEGYQGENGVMPPKGTCMSCSDDDIHHAVQYMLSKVTKPQG